MAERLKAAVFESLLLRYAIQVRICFYFKKKIYVS
jgi:hypothetical protein